MQTSVSYHFDQGHSHARRRPSAELGVWGFQGFRGFGFNLGYSGCCFGECPSRLLRGGKGPRHFAEQHQTRATWGLRKANIFSLP